MCTKRQYLSAYDTLAPILCFPSKVHSRNCCCSGIRDPEVGLTACYKLRLYQTYVTVAPPVHVGLPGVVELDFEGDVPEVEDIEVVDVGFVAVVLKKQLQAELTRSVVVEYWVRYVGRRTDVVARKLLQNAEALCFGFSSSRKTLSL